MSNNTDSLTPFYTPESVRPTYTLRYNWTGWPSKCQFPREPSEPFFDDLKARLETDGIRLLEYDWSARKLNFLASVKPDVSPNHFAMRMKGRLQYGLQLHGTPRKFSRKFSVRTIGENRVSTVEKYIEGQVAKERLADPRFEEFLRQFTVIHPEVDLTAPYASKSGRYWYTLHVVLVVKGRSRITDCETLALLRDRSFQIAAAKGHRISRLSVIPDHIHMALFGDVEQSPEEIALSYMNNLAYFAGHGGLWEPTYYVGTFGGYDMGAVRHKIAGKGKPAGG